MIKYIKFPINAGGGAGGYTLQQANMICFVELIANNDIKCWFNGGGTNYFRIQDGTGVNAFDATTISAINAALVKAAEQSWTDTVVTVNWPTGVAVDSAQLA